MHSCAHLRLPVGRPVRSLPGVPATVAWRRTAPKSYRVLGRGARSDRAPFDLGCAYLISAGPWLVLWNSARAASDHDQPTHIVRTEAHKSGTSKPRPTRFVINRELTGSPSHGKVTGSISVSFTALSHVSAPFRGTVTAERPTVSRGVDGTAATTPPLPIPCGDARRVAAPRPVPHRRCQPRHPAAPHPRAPQHRTAAPPQR